MKKLEKSLPEGFPRRTVHVDGWVRAFSVPRHIVRVDVDEPGLAGTHGWQVRYRKPSKFFSDIAGRNRRSPQASLAEATGYLASTYKGPRNRCRDTPLKSKQCGLDVGLGTYMRKRKGKDFHELYVVAYPPESRVSAPRFYVGTRHEDGSGTATEDRFHQAVELAKKARRKLVRAHNKNKPVWVR